MNTSRQKISKLKPAKVSFPAIFTVYDFCLFFCCRLDQKSNRTAQSPSVHARYGKDYNVIAVDYCDHV